MDANHQILYNFLIEARDASDQIQKDNEAIYNIQHMQKPDFPVWKTAKGVLWLVLTFAFLGSIGDSFVFLLFAALFGYFTVRDIMVIYNWYQGVQKYNQLQNSLSVFQKDKENQMSQHRTALSTLPTAPYYLNPQAYNKGAQFVASGLADSFGQVASLLDTFGLGN